MDAQQLQGESCTTKSQCDTGLDRPVEVTVIVPLFNEEDVLPKMYCRLKAVLTPLMLNYEILFVDDGSIDQTANLILDISVADDAVAGVFLSRHYGKEAALAAGLNQAKGYAVIIMDGDLQDPPECIPQMLQTWREGADVVRMCPRVSTDGSFPQKISRWFIVQVLIGRPKNHLDFMLYSKKAVSVLGLVVNRKRYMKGIFQWAGLQEVVIEYKRPPRKAGSSKWSITDLLGYSADGTTSAVDVLVRLTMLTGLVGLTAGSLYVCYSVIQFVMTSDPAQLASFAWVRLLLLGGGLVSLLAWLGERTLKLCPPLKRPQYTIKMRARCARMPTQ